MLCDCRCISYLLLQLQKLFSEKYCFLIFTGPMEFEMRKQDILYNMRNGSVKTIRNTISRKQETAKTLWPFMPTAPWAKNIPTGLITYTCKLDRQKQRALITQRVTRIVVVGAIALGVVTRTPGLTGGLVVTMY